MTEKCLMLFAVLLVFAADAAGQVQRDRYTIIGIEVDTTARSAAQAREIALTEGQRNALDRLLRGLTMREDHPSLPSLDDTRVLALVEGIEVTREKASSTRYIATLTVHFRADEIRSLLRLAGIPFSETFAKPALLLPVFESASVKTLWYDPNPWRDAWLAVDQTNRLTSFVFAAGTLADIATIGPEQAVDADEAALERMAKRYGVSDVYVAYAKQFRDWQDNRPTVRVQVYRFGSKVEAIGDEIFYLPSESETDPEQFRAALDGAVTRIVESVEDGWKRETLALYDAVQALDVIVPFATIEEWLFVRDRIGRMPTVRELTVDALSIYEARLRLRFVGDQGQLATSLAQSDLDLFQDGEDWLIAPRAGKGP